MISAPPSYTDENCSRLWGGRQMVLLLPGGLDHLLTAGNTGHQLTLASLQGNGPTLFLWGLTFRGKLDDSRPQLKMGWLTWGAAFRRQGSALWLASRKTSRHSPWPPGPRGLARRQWPLTSWEPRGLGRFCDRGLV